MRILIVNVNWFGDLLFSTFLIRCLKKKFPSAYLATLAAQDKVAVLENNPYLDNVIPFDFLKEKKSLLIDFSLLRELKNRNFSHSLHLHRSFTRRAYTYLSGVERRIGYREKFKGFLLTDKISSSRDKIHRARYYFRLAQVLGIEDDNGGLDFFLEKEELDFARAFLKQKKIDKFYIVHIGANWRPKQWPIAYWAKLIDLIKENHNIPAIVTGSCKDLEPAERLNKLTKFKPYILVGKTSLRELAALIKLSSFIVASDTAPLHMATALSVPVIGIYGPTSPDITGPFRPSNKSFVLLFYFRALCFCS